MKQQRSSPAIKLLQMVWDHCQEATDPCWLKLNHAMRETLSLAVRAGMRFDLDNFKRIFQNSEAGGFRAGYWVGADTDWFYNLAILYRNSSAWKTYEKYYGRKPFIVKGAYSHQHTGDGPAGHGLARLIVGARFIWKSQWIKVTSFNDKKGYFNAASLDGKRRFKIRHADLLKQRVRVPKKTAGLPEAAKNSGDS